MHTEDREELTAAFAGLHNIFTMLVRRLAYTKQLDLAELLVDLEAIMGSPGQHQTTLAVQEDVREMLLGSLPLNALDPQGLPRILEKTDLPKVAPMRRSMGFAPASPGASEPEMTLEERLQVQEILLEDALWGPHLDNPDYRLAVARALYTRLEAAQRHSTFPPAVQAALYLHADALSELDNTPDALRPALRPFARPASDSLEEGGAS